MEDDNHGGNDAGNDDKVNKADDNDSNHDGVDNDIYIYMTALRDDGGDDDDDNDDGVDDDDDDDEERKKERKKKAKKKE